MIQKIFDLLKRLLSRRREWTAEEILKREG